MLSSVSISVYNVLSATRSSQPPNELAEIAVSARAKLCLPPWILICGDALLLCRTEEIEYHILYRFCTLRDRSNEKSVNLKNT